MLGFLSNLYLVTQKPSSVCLPLSAAVGQEQQSLNFVDDLLHDDLPFQKAGKGEACAEESV